MDITAQVGFQQTALHAAITVVFYIPGSRVCSPFEPICNRIYKTADGKTVQAHVPNTGRMEEFCLVGQPFFVAPTPHSKYPYKGHCDELSGIVCFSGYDQGQ